MDPNEVLRNMEAAGFEPEVIKDEFSNLNGDYVANVQKVTRQEGTKKDGSSYDFLSINAQIEETVRGEKGDNRFVNGLTYPLTQDWGIPAFCNALFTAGIETDRRNIDTLLDSAQALVGKKINVRCWESGEYQRAKIVPEFKTKTAKEAVPF